MARKFKIFKVENSFVPLGYVYQVSLENPPGTQSYVPIVYRLNQTTDEQAQIEVILKDMDDDIIEFLQEEGATAYQLLPNGRPRTYFLTVWFSYPPEDAINIMELS